jgi:Rieske Fe-S protein
LELVKDIPGGGSHVFEGTRVMDIKEGKPCTLITEKGKKITADNVILASHYPCYDGRGMYFSRLYPTRSYGLGVRFKGNYLGGMYVTEEDPGRSVRSALYNGEEILIISGEHHKTGQGENTIDHYINMKKFVMDTFDVIDIPWRWSTQDYKTPDDVPYIGHLTSQTPSIYVATGFKKWGMTTSTVSAILIKDLITTGKSPWADLYNPSRFIPSASTAQTYVKENSNVAKHLIQGKLEGLPDKIDITKGEAKKVEIDGQKYGAYMDDKGKVHVVDTTCPHMGCEVVWNAAEKSWDCPCHGSRYTYEGDIIEGPAVHRLKYLGDGKNEIDPNIF